MARNGGAFSHGATARLDYTNDYLQYRKPRQQCPKIIIIGNSRELLHRENKSQRRYMRKLRIGSSRQSEEVSLESQKNLTQYSTLKPTQITVIDQEN